MNRAGRPRQSDIDGRIIRAVAELVVELGYSQVTVAEVVARAGTSKPAFYRRFSDIAEIVPLILAQYGTDEDIDTGSVVTDFLTVQIRQCALFNNPLTRAALPGFIDAALTNPDVGRPFVEGYIAPRRAFTSVILARAVERGEIEHYDDPAYVADLLTGPVIMRGVLPGMPPIDAALVAHTVNTLLTELGYTGDRTALEHVDFPPEAG